MDNDPILRKAKKYQQDPKGSPVATSLFLSSPTCSLTSPPLEATTIHECTSSRPIWALVHLSAEYHKGIEYRCIQGVRWRRWGPSPYVSDCNEDERDPLDREDADILRLEPGQNYSITHTIGEWDIPSLGAGNTHKVTLRKRRWKWMFEDEMGGDLTLDERRGVLQKREAHEWSVDCTRFFSTEWLP